MLHIDHALTDRNLKTRMTLQVHDELLFDTPEAKEVATLIKQQMESVLNAPLASSP